MPEFLSRHPILDLRVRSVGRNFFYSGEDQSRSHSLTTFFYISLVAGKNTLYPRLSLQWVVIRLWLVNATRGYNLTSEPRTIEALQNVFIFIYRCKIYPYYVQILFT